MPNARCPLPPRFYDWCDLYSVVQDAAPAAPGQPTCTDIRVYVRDDNRKRQEELIAQLDAALRLLDHPLIGTPCGTFDANGQPCLVMAHADGGNLRRYLKGHPDADRLVLASKVAEVLSYLHTETPRKQFIVIHGNIHSTTILIRKGDPLLLDFAFCSVTPTPASGALSLASVREGGFAPYLAPELLRSLPRTLATDVYAFGMLLFEMFAGQLL
ncbi:kinase-like protein [Auricularia subglabra TFB-10046 SS5]|nr:kinase-like protein [Auricularia subglabra TFB-10046 SS5]